MWNKAVHNLFKEFFGHRDDLTRDFVSGLSTMAFPLVAADTIVVVLNSQRAEWQPGHYDDVVKKLDFRRAVCAVVIRDQDTDKDDIIGIGMICAYHIGMNTLFFLDKPVMLSSDEIDSHLLD